MTDETKNDVIMGLKYCTQHQYMCSKCPFSELKHQNEYGESEVINESGERYDDYDCSYRLMQAALKVIEEWERQK